MSVKFEKAEGNKGTLTIEVPAEKLDTALDQAFKKVVKTVQAPGFRKGKMPRQMFEKMYGVEALYNDALDILLPEAYGNAIEEQGLEPVDRPEIDVVELEKGKNFIFTAEITLKPEVTLGDYKGLEATREPVEVTDEEIEAQLVEKQTALAELVIKEDGEVEEGDTVVLDFTGYADGEPFEGGNAEAFELEIGSGSFIPGFEEQMVGMKNDEEREINITFPEEYHAAELAGQPAMFDVKVHEIKTKEVPELDDELAKEIDNEVDSVEALRTKLKETAEESKKQSSEANLRDALIEQAVNNAEIDVPEVMFETEVGNMMQEFEQRLQTQGMNLELYFQFSGQDEAALREQMQADAEKRVRTSLTLEKIAEVEAFEVSEEEINAELEKMSAQFGMEIDQIKQALGNLSMLENDIRLNKTIDLLVENAKITE